MIDHFSPQHRIKELLMLIDERNPAPEVTAELFRVLEAHPEARAYYIERMHLQSEVRTKLREQQAAISPLLAEVIRRTVWRRRLQRATLVMLPLLLVLTGYFIWDHRQRLLAVAVAERPTAVATAEQALPLEAENLLTRYRRGQEFFPGEPYQLGPELLDLRFLNGTRCVIKGPAEFQLIDEQRLRLNQGEIVVDTSAHQQGFTVQLGGCEVVDIGTRFGVMVDSSGEAEVHVFQGLVELQAEAGRVPLEKEEAVEVASSGSVLRRKPAAVERFQQSYPLLDGIERVSGAVRLVLKSPTDLRHGSWEQTGAAGLFLESRRVLTEACLLSFARPGTFQEKTPRELVTLPTGTAVNCFMLHYNTVKNHPSQIHCSGTIVFADKILGLIVDDLLLDATDVSLGQPDVRYASGENKRGSVEVGDTVEIMADQRTLRFSIQAGAGHLDSLRVLTEARLTETEF